MATTCLEDPLYMTQPYTGGLELLGFGWELVGLQEASERLREEMGQLTEEEGGEPVRTIEDLKDQARPLLSRNTTEIIESWVADQIESSDWVEMQWTVDIFAHGPALYQSPLFACGGFLFCVSMLRSSTDRNVWGIYCQCDRPVSPDIETQSVHADCTLEIPDMGFEGSIINTDLWAKNGGWEKAVRLEGSQETIHVLVTVRNVKGVCVRPTFDLDY